MFIILLTVWHKAFAANWITLFCWWSRSKDLRNRNLTVTATSVQRHLLPGVGMSGSEVSSYNISWYKLPLQHVLMQSLYENVSLLKDLGCSQRMMCDFLLVSMGFRSSKGIYFCIDLHKRSPVYMTNVNRTRQTQLQYAPPPPCPLLKYPLLKCPLLKYHWIQAHLSLLCCDYGGQFKSGN